MPFAIPRIQYLNYSKTGNVSSGSPIITNIASTTGLQVGMFCRGTNIPSTATILSVDSGTQITLNQNATGTATGVALELGFEILFSYPPIEAKGEIYDPKERESTSISGVVQVSVDHIEVVRKFKFSFLTEALKNSLETFASTHALYGKTFRYFNDQTLSTYLDVELKTRKFEPKKIAPKGIDVYTWEVDLDTRRAL